MPSGLSSKNFISLTLSCFSSLVLVLLIKPNNYFTFTLIFIYRFLLKSLLQYQSLSEGEILPTPSSSSHPPVPPVAFTSSPAGASGLSAGHNLASVVSTGEDGPLKKPKKERKERGKENGKEERECCGKVSVKNTY